MKVFTDSGLAMFESVHSLSKVLLCLKLFTDLVLLCLKVDRDFYA